MAFLAPAVPGASSRSQLHGAPLLRTCGGAGAAAGTAVKRSAVVRAVALDADKKKTPKLSKVEGIKTASQQLRYPLHEQLGNDEIFISETAVQVMKFHGSYQQDDRDRRAPGQQKKFQFMLRLKMPSGEFPAALYRTLDNLSDTYGNGTLRATTRCAWQLHGVLKGDLKSVFSSIMNNGGATVGACGDLSRNVMTTPAPFIAKPYAHARFISKMLGELFAPQTGAFSEIWLDGEKAATLEYWKNDIDMAELQRIMREDNGRGVVFPDKEEPIYGETYLPRKFKIGVTVPGDNSIDIYTQDIGIVVLSNASGDIVGYNVIVGGGMGRTHNKESTFARTGDHLGFVPADKLYDVCKAIVAAQRDHGNREVRANARMKYLVHKMGIDAFRKLVETYYGCEIEPYREVVPWKYEDWLGWHEQGDGNFFLGLFVENGRIKDEDDFRLKTALRRIIDSFGVDMVVSPNQNVILKNITSNQRSGVEAILEEHGVKLVEHYDKNHRLSMACPAMPLCGLAVTEAERHMPSIIARMNALFKRTGATTVPITMRMTGCPNGCARPYMAEIGFVGSGPLVYQLWLGGCPNQTRLAFPAFEKVKDADLERVLEPMLVAYKQRALTAEEAFGDFCARMGKAELVRIVDAGIPKSDDAVKPTPVAAASSRTSASPTAASSAHLRTPPNAFQSDVTIAGVLPRVTVISSDGKSSELAPMPATPSTKSPAAKAPTVAAEVARSESKAESTANANSDEVAKSEVSPAKGGLSDKPDGGKSKSGSRKASIRPRLTVTPAIMERLKNIAALRDMSASQVADEIITTYLSGVEDEDLLGDGDGL